MAPWKWKGPGAGMILQRKGIWETLEEQQRSRCVGTGQAADTWDTFWYTASFSSPIPLQIVTEPDYTSGSAGLTQLHPHSQNWREHAQLSTSEMAHSAEGNILKSRCSTCVMNSLVIISFLQTKLIPGKLSLLFLHTLNGQSGFLHKQNSMHSHSSTIGFIGIFTSSLSVQSPQASQWTHRKILSISHSLALFLCPFLSVSLPFSNKFCKFPNNTSGSRKLKW